MAIHNNTPYSDVRLTGESVEAFERQFLEPNVPRNEAAQNSLNKGRELLKEMQAKGYVSFSSDSSKRK